MKHQTTLSDLVGDSYSDENASGIDFMLGARNRADLKGIMFEKGVKKMRLIDAEKIADSYCKKMCAGKCSGKEKEKCKFMELIEEQPDVSGDMRGVKNVET